MGYYQNDVYYNPEAFGLELVGEIEWAEPDYSFDFSIILKKNRGEYYFASDSGCSCPCPFEDSTSVESCEGPYNKVRLKERIDQMISERASDGVYYSYTHSRAELQRQAREVLSRLK